MFLSFIGLGYGLILSHDPLDFFCKKSIELLVRNMGEELISLKKINIPHRLFENRIIFQFFFIFLDDITDFFVENIIYLSKLIGIP